MTTALNPAELARILSTASLLNLSAVHLHTLCILAAQRSEMSNMTHLARALGLSTAAITGVIDTLEQRQLVIRQNVPSDRRQILIHLTERGDAALTEILTA